MRNVRGERGIALIAVLFATVLLLSLVTVLVELGTLQLQKSTADLRALQALAGADAGTAWVRAVLEQQHGDVQATTARLGYTQGKRRMRIDNQTYVVTTVVLLGPPGGPTNDHLDSNLEQYPRATEQPVQVESSAAVFVDSVSVTTRATTTLLRVFETDPYSEIVGFIDDASPVGIDSPGDAAGQFAGPNATELLVHAYTMNKPGDPNKVDKFGDTLWSDNNTAGGPGPLP
jgi:hypothetical protein